PLQPATAARHRPDEGTTGRARCRGERRTTQYRGALRRSAAVRHHCGGRLRRDPAGRTEGSARLMAAALRRTRTRHDHWRWLELVDRDGPFVAIPALKLAWPQGIVPGEEPRDVIRDAKPAFDRAWDTLQISGADTDVALGDFRSARDTWIDRVLRNAFRWDRQLV